MASASSTSARTLFSESKSRLADRVQVNVNNVASVARQINRGSKSSETLLHAARNFALQEHAIDNSEQNFKKMSIAVVPLGIQYNSIHKSCQLLEDVKEQLPSTMQELEQHPGDLESVCEPQLQCTDTKSEKQDSNIWIPLDFQFDNVIRMTGAWRDFNPREIEDSMATFTKGCKWAPDGTCILTNSDDHMLRIFNLPESIYGVSSWDTATNKLPSDLDQAVSCREGGTIYDFCWYPGMTSLEPLTCCIASCSRKSPVHLWDAFNGSLRASYSPYNQYDEVEAAHSVAFSADGQKLYCGSENVIRIFDLAKPGRQCEKRNLKCSSLMPQERQAGIVSCIATNPTEQKIYAVGSYQKTLGIYGEPDGALLCLLKAHVGGVTHIQFSPDGTKLFSGGRKDPEIFCWDLRCPGKFLTSYQRTVLTNQRIYFDISSNGKYLVSGNTNGDVTVYDASADFGNEESPTVVRSSQCWNAHADCTNGVSLHPTLPIVATSSGQRHFLDDSESDEDDVNQCENCLVFWWTGPTAMNLT